MHFRIVKKTDEKSTQNAKGKDVLSLFKGLLEAFLLLVCPFKLNKNAMPVFL